MYAGKTLCLNLVLTTSGYPLIFQNWVLLNMLTRLILDECSGILRALLFPEYRHVEKKT